MSTFYGWQGGVGDLSPEVVAVADGPPKLSSYHMVSFSGLTTSVNAIYKYEKYIFRKVTLNTKIKILAHPISGDLLLPITIRYYLRCKITGGSDQKRVEFLEIDTREVPVLMISKAFRVSDIIREWHSIVFFTVDFQVIKGSGYDFPNTIHYMVYDQ